MTAETIAHVAKAGLIVDLKRLMKRHKVSQSDLARRMSTSRAVVHRLLKHDDPSVTLSTISKAAAALGRTIKIRMAT